MTSKWVSRAQLAIELLQEGADHVELAVHEMEQASQIAGNADIREVERILHEMSVELGIYAAKINNRILEIQGATKRVEQ